jgi:hypothetical protein
MVSRFGKLSLPATIINLGKREGDDRLSCRVRDPGTDQLSELV